MVVFKKMMFHRVYRVKFTKNGYEDCAKNYRHRVLKFGLDMQVMHYCDVPFFHRDILDSFFLINFFDIQPLGNGRTADDLMKI